MAQIKTFTASRSRKINLGSYESADAFASVTIEFEPGDDMLAEMRNAYATVQSQLHEQMEIIIKGDEPMPIRGLTQTTPSFPQIGNIRKGAPKPASGNKPGADLNYFRVVFNANESDAERVFVDAYGKEPQEIRVYLPYDDIERNFETWKEEYSAGGLKHRCDGETIQYPLERRGQPCEQSTCPGKPVGRLRVVIPELQRFAYLMAHTTSLYDIINLSGQLQAVYALAGRFQGVPLILRRVEREVSVNTKDGKRRYKKWLLDIEIDPIWVRGKMAALAKDALPMPARLELPSGMIVDTDTGEVDDWDDDDYELLEMQDYASRPLPEEKPPIVTPPALAQKKAPPPAPPKTGNNDGHWSRTEIKGSNQTLGQRFLSKLGELKSGASQTDLLRAVLGVPTLAEYPGTAEDAGKALAAFAELWEMWDNKTLTDDLYTNVIADTDAAKRSSDVKHVITHVDDVKAMFRWLQLTGGFGNVDAKDALQNNHLVLQGVALAHVDAWFAAKDEVPF